MRDVEAAEEMDPDHRLEVGDAHLVEDAVAQDAGVVDDAVDAPEGVERGRDDALGPGGLGDAVGLATALPPALLISSHDRLGGAASLPSPSALPPRSLTTTLPPSAAASSAISRPMPRPAPVTTTTLPSRHLFPPIAASFPSCFRCRRGLWHGAGASVNARMPRPRIDARICPVRECGARNDPRGSRPWRSTRRRS